jgi:hypothetical protein
MFLHCKNIRAISEMAAREKNKTLSFTASKELEERIINTFERLEKTEWMLDKTLVNKSTLIRSAILEGLAVLEKKYLGGKNQ